MDLSNRPKLTYSVPEAAKVLGVSASKMCEVVRIEGFPTIRVDNRQKYCGTMQFQSIRNNRKSSDYYYRKKKEGQENL